jgi:hypothetical protein
MNDGCAGILVDVTANVLTGLEPQLFEAKTCICPLAIPTLAEMLLVIELPDQPLGSIQV